MLNDLSMRQRLRAQDGFTLVELLVTMVAGMVVLSAVFTVLDVTLHQTTRTFNKVDASQQARVATETIENELHSGCVGPGSPPVQAGSDANDLIFVSQWGSTATNANVASPVPVEHKLVFSGGALTDAVYPATDTAAPWTFASSPSSTTVVLSDAAAATDSSGNPLPVFQYFNYSEPLQTNGQPYEDAAGNPYMMIQDGINFVPGTTSNPPAAQPLATPLSATNAQSTAEVLVNLVAGPESGMQTSLISSVGATIRDQIALRLTAAANHASGSTVNPCS